MSEQEKMPPGPDLALGFAAAELPEGQMVGGACAGKPKGRASSAHPRRTAAETQPAMGKARG